jgi:hypothetical protein
VVGALSHRRAVDYHRRWWRRPELGAGVWRWRGERRRPEAEEVGAAAGVVAGGNGGVVGPRDEDA